MNQGNKTLWGYVSIISGFITLQGVFFMFISFLGTNTDIRTIKIAALITGLAASMSVWMFKQEQRRTAQLQEILKLSLLTRLDLSGKGLSKLPPELFQLTKLTSLEVLNLSGNQLATFPPEIFELTNLTQLDLSNNQLTALPPNILQLINLAVLNLSGNKLTTLPSEIFELTSLTQLNLSGNQIAALPSDILQLKNLTELDLSNNQLTILPEEIIQLTRLETLHLKNCPLTSPPAEIAQHGIEAVRSYFASLKEEVLTLNEVKILFIGDGAAGKTSLVKRLVGEAFNQHEETTRGINIQDWEQDVGGQRLKMNLWDFGGQVIQHATHQFFLSKRSLYILVLDGRKDEQAEYWLRYIEAFSGGSPVLIVLNKQDENPSFDLNRPFLLEKYPSIHGFFPISCLNGKGIPDFKEALFKELAKVPMRGTHWPKSWFTVKRRLEQMYKDYISSDEYMSYCAEAGITDEQSCETLLDYLNDLGVVVHFNDIDLKAMNVLNPDWVTDAVYKIITAEQMADNKGLLHLKHLSEILRHGDGAKCCYPDATHPYIISLMRKFELCYPVDKEAVLIPQLLPVIEPQFSLKQEGALRFALHYPDFLPPSVFPRFMVKVHKDIHENTCWRTGVWLEDKRSGAQALVKADVEARRINILVQGDNPREYLHYLRYLLADINSGFEKLTVMELVPMPDNPEVSADYENLLDLAEAGSDIFIPIGSRNRYSVKELLGLVQPKDKAELERVAQKASPQDTTTWVEMLTELVEPKWTVPVIGINLKGFFQKLLARQKQKQRQARR